MPEEIFIIVVVAIVAGTVTSLARIFVKARRDESGGSAQGSSLTSSELRQLLLEAVEEGTQPLAARVERLEEQLAERPALPSPPEAHRTLPGASEERAGSPRSL